MLSSDPVSCLHLELKSYQLALKKNLDQLVNIPGCFTGLAWQFDHDFLFMSASVTSLLGFPISKFEKSGVMFLHSITPNHQIAPLYEAINGQLAEMEKDDDYFKKPFLIRTSTMLYNSDQEEREIEFTALPLDFRPEAKNAYLSLGTLFVTSGRNQKEKRKTLELISRLMQKIKTDYVRSNPSRFTFLRAMDDMTPRERQVAELICKGLKTREVADKLFISHNTVDTHRKNLLAKFQVRNTAELIHKLSPYLY